MDLTKILNILNIVRVTARLLARILGAEPKKQKEPKTKEDSDAA